MSGIDYAKEIEDELASSTRSGTEVSDPLTSAIDEEVANQRSELWANTRIGVQSSPDKYASLYRTGQTLGLDPSVIAAAESHSKEVERFNSMGLDSLAHQTPRLATWLSNIDNVSMAHDDVASGSLVKFYAAMAGTPHYGWPMALAEMATHTPGAKGTAVAWQGGWNQYKISEYSLESMGKGLDPTEDPRIAASEAIVAASQRATEETSRPLKTVMKNVQILPGMLVAAGTGAATGTVAAATAVGSGAEPLMPFAFAGGMALGSGYSTARQEGGAAYLQYVRDMKASGGPVDLAAAKRAADTVGAINGLIEVGGFAALLAFLPGLKFLADGPKVAVQQSIRKLVGKSLLGYGAELASESLQEGAQAVVTDVGGKIATGEPISALDEAQIGAKETLGSIESFALLGGLGAGVSLHQQIQQHNDGVRSEARFNEYGRLIQGVNLAKRSSEKTAEIAGLAVDDGHPSTVYLGTNEFTTLFQTEKIPPQEAANQLGIGDEFKNAVAQGTDIAIPFTTYASKIANTPYNNRLIGDLKMYGIDSMTANERVVFEANWKELQKQVDEIKAGTDKLGDDPAYALRYKQLIDADRTPTEAKYYAKLHAAVINTMGSREGVDILGEFPLVVTSETNPKGELNQAALRSGEQLGRTVHEIRANIGDEKFVVGDHKEGYPLPSVVNGAILERDLDRPGLGWDKPEAQLQSIVTQSFDSAVAETKRGQEVVSSLPDTMQPKGAEFWSRALALPDRARFWYEISAAYFKKTFPDFTEEELSRFIDTVAATSPQANPYLNIARAVGVFSEHLAHVPVATDIISPTSVGHALSGTGLEGSKVRSFSGTMKYILGLSAEKPMSTNDRQVASTFGIGPNTIGSNPALYEVLSRFYINMRDALNANLPKGAEPYQTWQIQALGWVQERYDSEKRGGSGVATSSDDYQQALSRLMDRLSKAGVAVENGAITADALANPVVPNAVSNTRQEFLDAPVATVEVQTLLSKNGQSIKDAVERARASEDVASLEEFDSITKRAFSELGQRSGGANGTSLAERIASLIKGKKVRIPRVSYGLGTYQGSVGANIRLPLLGMTETEIESFLSVIGEAWQQGAMAASEFREVDINSAPWPGFTRTYQIFLEGRTAITNDEIARLSEALGGNELNVSTEIANGIVIDINPQFGEQGPVSPEPATVHAAAGGVFGTHTFEVFAMNHKSTYIERADYSAKVQAHGEVTRSKAVEAIVGKSGLDRDLIAKYLDTTAPGLSRKLLDRAAKAGVRASLRNNSSLTVTEEARAAKLKDQYRSGVSSLASLKTETAKILSDYESSLVNAWMPRAESRYQRLQKALGAIQSINEVNDQQYASDPSPTRPVSDRWTADRGAMPGEPMMTLDVDPATGEGTAAVVEVSDPQTGEIVGVQAVAPDVGAVGPLRKTADDAARDAEAYSEGSASGILKDRGPLFIGRPVRPEATQVAVVRYTSRPGRTEVDPRSAGLGAGGTERRRFGMGNYGAHGGLSARAYFYVREGEGLPEPEKTVPSDFSYQAVLGNMYDLRTDPLGIAARVGTSNLDKLEEAISSAGFDGRISAAGPGMNSPTAVVFNLPYGMTIPVEAIPSQYSVQAGQRRLDLTYDSKAVERDGEPLLSIAPEPATGSMSDKPITLFSRIAKDFKATGFVDWKGTKISSPADLAFLARVLRDPRYETFRIFWMKGDQIITNEAISSSHPRMSSTRVGQESGPDAVARMIATKERLGADGYWFVHNHPSGDVSPSQADMNMTAGYSIDVPGMLGHVIINHKRFAHLSVDKPIRGMWSTVGGVFVRHAYGDVPDIKTLGPDPLLGPPFNEFVRSKLGKEISEIDVRGPVDISYLGRAIRDGVKGMEAYVPIVYIGVRGDVRFVEEVPLHLFDSKLAFRSHVQNNARNSGASYASAYVTSQKLLAMARAHVRIGTLADAVTPAPKRSNHGYGVSARKSGNHADMDALFSEQQEAVKLYQRVFQGSPIKALVGGKYSDQYIGTGENTQGQGAGHYFTSRLGAAEWYRDVLSTVAGKTGITFPDGVEYRLNRPDVPASWMQAAAALNQSKGGGTLDQSGEARPDIAVERLKSRSKEWQHNMSKWGDITVPGQVAALSEQISRTQEAIDLIESGKVKWTAPGQVFEAEIPDDSNLASWDELIGHHSESIQGKLASSGLIEKVASSMETPSGVDSREAVDGMVFSQFYRRLSEVIRADQILSGNPRFNTSVPSNELVKESNILASSALRDAGIPGHSYVSGSNNKNFVIYDPSQIEVVDTLYQSTLGSITLMAEGRPYHINLGPQANESTFLHESGHMFLDVMSRLYLRDTASAQLKEDYETALKWLGYESNGDRVDSLAEMRVLAMGEAAGTATPQDLERLSFLVSREEKWANGFEAFLMEGKAPSVEMIRPFTRFARWLSSIYKKIQALGVDVPDDIKQVMGRMIATDEQISQVESHDKYIPMFKDAAEAGMTEEKFKAYQNLAEEAHWEAYREVDLKIRADQERETRSWWKEERAKVQAEVTGVVDAKPSVRAAQFLRDGTVPEDLDPKNGLLYPDGSPVKISTAALDEVYGTLSRGIKKKLGPSALQAVGGVHPDSIGPVFGFKSGDEMIRAITGEESRSKQIAAGTKKIMGERHGDIMTQGNLESASRDAVHESTLHLKQLQAELDALNRKAGKRVVKISKSTLAAYAEQQINTAKVRDIDPNRYLQAERKSATEAINANAKGKFDEAVEWQRKRMINRFLYSASKKGKEEAAKASTFLAKQDTTSQRAKLGLMDTVDPVTGEVLHSYLDQQDKLLERFDFRKISRQGSRARESLAAWVQVEIASGRDPIVPPKLLNESLKKNWQDMTLDELMDLSDAVKNIRHLANKKARILVAGQELMFEAVVNEGVAEIKSNVPAKSAVQVSESNKSWAERTIYENMRRIDSELVRLRELADQLDGGNANGIFHRVLVHPFDDAAVADHELNVKVTKIIDQAIQDLPAKMRSDLSSRSTVLIPSIKQSVLFSDLIAFGLNTGNESNLFKMMTGWQTESMGNIPWTDQTFSEMHSQLKEEHWDFIQKLWDALETLWPEASALERELTGLAPAKVEPKPFVFNRPDGTSKTYRGGYYPVIYHPLHSGKELAAPVGVGGQLYDPSHDRAVTPHGHLVDRVETYARPVSLKLERIVGNIASVIHDTTHRRALLDAWRFLNDRGIREALVQNLGEEYYRMMLERMRRIANNRNQPSAFLGAVHRVQGAVSASMMAWKMSVTLQNFANVILAKQAVGTVPFASASIQFAKRPFETLAWVQQVSGQMRHRTETRDNELRQVFEENISLKSNRAKFIKNMVVKTGYKMMAYTNAVTEFPAWLAAFQNAQKLDPSLTEVELVRIADDKVISTFGSGSVKDLALVQDTEAMRPFTMFYGFFSAVYNMTRKAKRGTVGEWRQGRRASATAHALEYVLWNMVVMNALSEVFSGRPPDDDDKENLGEWLALRGASYAFAMVPFARDIYRAIEQKRRDVSLTPLASMLSEIARTGQEVAKAGQEILESDDLTMDDVLDPAGRIGLQAAKVAGIAYSLPVAQAKITGGYLWELLTDQDSPETWAEGLHNLLYTKPRKKAS